MKRIVALILTFAMLGASFAFASANIPNTEDLQTILNVMEIMTFDARGSFNENQYVTRAQLAKMLVSASPYKGAATQTSRVSPFGDVMYTHWGAPYISVAAKNKFMTGYSDGTFRPDRSILYEEAFSAILRLLGYTNDDYTGAYPAGQLAKADDIGLSDHVAVAVGSPITRGEMAKILYNMLNAEAKGKKTLYAEELGYTLTSEMLTVGDVIKDNVTGPVTVKAGTIASLGLSGAKIYRNGKASSESAIEQFDVIYYSKKSNMVWAYSQKVTGLLNTIAPNKEDPISVTVSGINYPLNYYAAQKAFGLDGLEEGDTVTMLLDKNGKVCDAYKASALYETEIGVITAVNAKTITAADGTKTTGYYATVLLTDGSTVDIPQSNDSTSNVGKAVRIDYKSNSYTNIRTGTTAVTGYINAESRTWGSSTLLAANIKILEIDSNGNSVPLSLSRLDGVRLNAENVLLSSKNDSGAVDSLIIKNVTGDTNKYGIITSVVKSRRDGSGAAVPIPYTYYFDIGGMQSSFSFGTVDSGDIVEGPAVFIYKNGVIDKIKNLTSAKDVVQLTPSYATLSSNVKHRISSDVLVYKVIDDNKVRVTLDEALSYTGNILLYYDKIQSEGGLVRVIYLK